MIRKLASLSIDPMFAGGVMSTTPSSAPQDADDVSPAAAIPERSSSDHLLRLFQQHHVQLSTMADTKASMIITISSIVLTIALGRLHDSEYRIALIVLTIFTMLALLMAIMAVLPKFRGVKRLDGPIPPGFNMMFFGHFTALPPERYIREMAERMMPGKAYETVLMDVYGLGQYLAQHKYPYLRWAYVFFLSGFVLACLAQLWQVMFT
ncbi:Pycsar system effector family protein [Pseudomarimonas arenosa]|uniref:Pycsar effector protein domain-containing protein n=1 Tax=Pseudomarimonas arenosa TaxID=2774145 RepID=A0AAW3ZM75_9GAMM|nr:Pycsar system effector family protein [Pseudomarimonas arenosa]MBD8527161.1 hypothetical protein [Pseudomarimonas arenosa]